jgi:hypothetical protein
VSEGSPARLFFIGKQQRYVSLDALCRRRASIIGRYRVPYCPVEGQPQPSEIAKRDEEQRTGARNKPGSLQRVVPEDARSLLDTP